MSNIKSIPIKGIYAGEQTRALFRGDFTLLVSLHSASPTL